jgi:protein DGCR14
LPSSGRTAAWSAGQRPGDRRVYKKTEGQRDIIVLEEEDWMAAMEGIIERDFFPDIRVLREQMELNAGQMHGRGDLPDRNVPKMTLDEFLLKHTSEDNASFREILDKSHARQKEKMAYLLNPPNPSAPHLLGSVQNNDSKSSQARVTDGFGTTGQGDDKLISWKYSPMNALMFKGSQKNLVPHRKASSLKNIAGINHSATGTLQNWAKEDSVVLKGTPDADDGQPETRDYSILSTPVFEPGEDGTPIITWGKIDATPQVLLDDMPDSGVGFKIQQTPARDEIARNLGTRASASIAKRHDSLRKNVLSRHGMTPDHSATGQKTPSMSPAARRLASAIQKKKKHRSL